MATLNITVASGRTSDQLQKLQVAGGKHSQVRNLLNYLHSVTSGCEAAVDASTPRSMIVEVQDSKVKASGTLTLASVIATNTAIINGVTFTAVAAGATGNQFNVGGTDTITAANLAAAINASVTALVAGYVTATSAAAVVTVSSAFYGLAGNQTTIAGGGATVTASGARFDGWRC